jgi:hypothetical protein
MKGFSMTDTAETKHACPGCGKEFDTLYRVHTRKDEPFIGLDPIEGLEAYSAYWVEKTVICHQDKHVHIQFIEGDKEERLILNVMFDDAAFFAERERQREEEKPCEHEGCLNVGAAVYQRRLDETPDGYFCDDHAHVEGYCLGCGVFSSGEEVFDFSPDHLCAACQEELNDALSDAFELDDDEYDEEDPYYDPNDDDFDDEEEFDEDEDDDY